MLNTSVCRRLWTSEKSVVRVSTLAACLFSLLSCGSPAGAQIAPTSPTAPGARFVSPFNGPPPQVTTGATPTLNANKMLMYQTLGQKQTETQLRDSYIGQEKTIEQELAKLPKNVSSKSAAGVEENKLQSQLNLDKQYVQQFDNNISVLDRWVQYYQAKAQTAKWNRAQDRQAITDQRKSLAAQATNNALEAQTAAGTSYWQVINTPVSSGSPFDGWTSIPIQCL